MSHSITEPASQKLSEFKDAKAFAAECKRILSKYPAGHKQRPKIERQIRGE
jgi:hypothetical protein